MNLVKLFLIFLLGGLAPLHAAVPGTEAILHRAHKARGEGLPQVVLYDLKLALLSETDPARRVQLAVELARCFIAGGRPGEAIQQLDQVEFLPDAEAQFWLAQALAEAGEIETARAKYQQLGGMKGFRRALDARLGEARMLEALGQSSQAAAVLEALAAEPDAQPSTSLDLARIYVSDRKFEPALRVLDGLPELSGIQRDRAEFLKAQITLDRGNADLALSIFDETLKSEDPAIRSGSLIGAAEALVLSGRASEAEQRLEAVIDGSPNDPRIGEVFAKLDELYAAGKDATGTELRRWARDKEHRSLATYATFYQARQDLRTGRVPQALEGFQRFANQQKGHSLRGKSMAAAVQILLAEGRTAEAAEVLRPTNELAPNDPSRVELQFLLGNIYLASNRASAARATFLSVARRSPRLEAAARDNAALAEALGGEVPKTALPGAEGTISEEAALTRALIGAREQRDGAALLKLGNSAEEPSIRARAEFAAAEFAWVEGDPDEARLRLQRVANSPDVPSSESDAFAVFLADDGTREGDRKVTRLAREYLASHSDAARAPEVRMKLAEVLARLGDHRSAWIEFESAARDSRDRSIQAAALFFAAQSAARSLDKQGAEQSILLYEEVVRDGGPLAGRARFEQALLQSALGRSDDALVLLDRLIADTGDPALKTSALIEKGDTLFSQNDPAKLKEAIAVWMQVAREGGVSVADRNETLTKSAAAHEKLGESDAALSRYYQVIESPSESEPEYFWYYKAGFEAARLLESQGRWQEALVVYQKLSASKGPRASEAESRVKRLRLENFIWE